MRIVCSYIVITQCYILKKSENLQFMVVLVKDIGDLITTERDILNNGRCSY
jgi:hypothetical protein